MITTYKGYNYSVEEVLEKIGPHISDDRIAKMKSVLEKRSLHFIPILEKIFDHGNINAVFRSAESMGFQRVDIIENEKIRMANRVSKGANKWLSIYKWQNTKDCIDHLKTQGYKILVTHLDSKAKEISHFNFEEKTALIYGSEGFGVSEEAIDLADESVILPMDGFTQSYNISVAAAISMYHIKQDRIQRLGKNGDLKEEEKKELLSHYFLASLNKTSQKIAKDIRKDSR